MKSIQVGRLNNFFLDLWAPNFKLGNLAIQVVLNGSAKFISFSKHSSSSQAVCDRLASSCFTSCGKPASIIFEKARFVPSRQFRELEMKQLILHYKYLSLCYQDLSSEILVSDKLLMGARIHKLLLGCDLASPLEVNPLKAE